jgi:hypothetical protein
LYIRVGTYCHNGGVRGPALLAMTRRARDEW